MRHCSQHPAKEHEELMVFILEDNTDLVAFTAFLHWVMFRAGQLRLLNLETTMG